MVLKTEKHSVTTFYKMHLRLVKIPVSELKTKVVLRHFIPLNISSPQLGTFNVCKVHNLLSEP